jgi:hypothetical protein
MRLFALLLVSCALPAAVTHMYVEERTDVLNGAPMGKAGPYERFKGKVLLAVDPKLPANAAIVDLNLAPRNAEGLVEFAADFVMIRPRDPREGNGTILFEVSNRGGMGMLGMFNGGRGSTEMGDRFLLEQGFTMLWVAWQADVPLRDGLLRLTAPVAKGVEGVVRADWVVDAKSTKVMLSDRSHIPYAALSDQGLRLTVRDTPDGARREVPRADWTLVDGMTAVEMKAGFVPGQIYEVVYRAKDPVIAGLGPAAIRDTISFLKYGGGPSLAFANNRHKRAIGFGTSQSGRFLRKYLYDGFNADEKGRPVFDGVWAHVAGAGRGSFNHRFAQPSRDGHPMLNFFYPTDLFPFTDLPETDGSRTEGLLDRTVAQKVMPKIFYTNGSYEYYGRAASLIHTSVDGGKDAALPADTRVYFLAGTQHGPAARPARNGTQFTANPMDYRWNMRALLLAMQAWLAEGAAPPESMYPSVAKGQLVAPAQLAWPKVPGVEKPSRIHLAYRVDYGPEFAEKGIITKEPPQVGAPFGVRVPQVNGDGNETSGVAAPELLAPLGTYTGWNYRDAQIGAPGMLYNMVGSFHPFAKTKQEREAKRDPRPSIEERYRSKDGYLGEVRQAARQLAAQRLILAADEDRIVAQCAERWDWVMRQ